MYFSEVVFILTMTLSVIVILYISLERKIAMRRSLSMTFLRVIIARKDSDQDEKHETVKDFREQISIMEQLLLLRHGAVVFGATAFSRARTSWQGPG